MEEAKNRGFELVIPENEITERITVTEGIELIRYSEGIALHFGGMWLVSRPVESLNARGGSLYEMLDRACEHYSGRQETDENIDTFYTAVIATLLLPAELFSDMGYFIDCADYTLKRRKALYESLMRRAEKGSESDPIGDAEFVSAVEMAEQVGKMTKKS